MASMTTNVFAFGNPQKWQDLFNQHLNLLNEHLEVWKFVKNQQQPESKHHHAVQDCIDRTQVMIQNVEHLFDAFDVGNNNQSQQPGSNPSTDLKTDPSNTTPLAAQEQTETLALRTLKRRRGEDTIHTSASVTPNKPVKDVSGLFTIDARPTPVEQLLSQSSNRDENHRHSKRSKGFSPRSEAEQVDTHGSSKRTNQIPVPKFKREPEPGKHVLNQPKVSSNPSDLPTMDDNDLFRAKVEKRYLEKVEKRRRKLEKKRKRGSETSIDAEGQGLAMRETRKKKKLTQQDDLETGQVDGQQPISKKSSKKRSTSVQHEKIKRQKRD